jgi:hypothetical protein
MMAISRKTSVWFLAVVAGWLLTVAPMANAEVNAFSCRVCHSAKEIAAPGITPWELRGGRGRLVCPGLNRLARELDLYAMERNGLSRGIESGPDPAPLREEIQRIDRAARGVLDRPVGDAAWIVDVAWEARAALFEKVMAPLDRRDQEQRALWLLALMCGASFGLAAAGAVRAFRRKKKEDRRASP